MEEIYIAGIGISPFVDDAERLYRKMPSIKIFAIEDICCILNVNELGEVLETESSALRSMLRTARITPIQSSALMSSLPSRDISMVSDVSWRDFFNVMGYRLKMIADLEGIDDARACKAKRKILLELLKNRCRSIHNAMPPLEWLDQAGFWDYNVVCPCQ